MPDDLPKLEVQYRPLDALIPYARNARTHSENQVAQIAASIEEFGWTNPVLVDGQNGVIAGHGRLLAAKRLGMAQVPVIELAGLSEAQKRAYVIADNKLAENAGWDFDILAAEFGELQALDFDLAKLGFGDDEIASIKTKEDNATEGPTASGQLAAKFGIPPFSVLNAREGWWQERKRAWVALGIQSELGRPAVQSSLSSARKLQKKHA